MVRDVGSNGLKFGSEKPSTMSGWLGSPSFKLGSTI